MKEKATPKTRPLIVAMFNAGGSSGKSTTDAHLVSPKLHAKRVQVEEADAEGKPVNPGVGKYEMWVTLADFEDAVVALKKNGESNVVLDIGASSTGAGITEVLARYPRTLQAIDYWIVPVKPTVHSQNGAATSVGFLDSIQVPANRIILIPNDVVPTRRRDTTWHDVYANTYALRDAGVFVSDEPIWHHEIIGEFGKLGREGLQVPETVWSLVHNQSYEGVEQLLRAAQDAKDEAAEDRWAQRLTDYEACEQIVKNFELVWAKLPIAKALQAQPTTAQPATV